MFSCLNNLAMEYLTNSWNYDADSLADMGALLCKHRESRTSTILQMANARLIMSKISRSLQYAQSSNPALHVDFSDTASWFMM